MVSTSNRAPDKLYEGGLQRDLFLPFIATLKVWNTYQQTFTNFSAVDFNFICDYYNFWRRVAKRLLWIFQKRCVIHEIGSSTDYRRLTAVRVKASYASHPCCVIVIPSHFILLIRLSYLLSCLSENQVLENLIGHIYVCFATYYVNPILIFFCMKWTGWNWILFYGSWSLWNSEEVISSRVRWRGDQTNDCGGHHGSKVKGMTVELGLCLLCLTSVLQKGCCVSFPFVPVWQLVGTQDHGSRYSWKERLREYSRISFWNALVCKRVETGIAFVRCFLTI